MYEDLDFIERLSQKLYDTFAECAAHPEYFDFSQKTSDQPIINYMILKRIPRRFNLVRRPGGAPGSWGGSHHFQKQNGTLVDPRNGNQPLQYLHWAGIRIEPGCSIGKRGNTIAIWAIPTPLKIRLPKSQTISGKRC
nr:hypothetical protein [Lusitaniella coriacea]